jgi:hypothetical protein
MKPPLLTPEEMEQVKDAVVIPVMLEYIRDDLDAVRKAGLRLDLIVIQGLRLMQDRIIAEHGELKRALRRQGIKITSTRTSAAGIEATYLCRGYRHRMSLLWDTVRTAILHRASRCAHISLTEGDAP